MERDLRRPADRRGDERETGGLRLEQEQGLRFDRTGRACNVGRPEQIADVLSLSQQPDGLRVGNRGDGLALGSVTGHEADDVGAAPAGVGDRATEEVHPLLAAQVRRAENRRGVAVKAELGADGITGTPRRHAAVVNRVGDDVDTLPSIAARYEVIDLVLGHRDHPGRAGCEQALDPALSPGQLEPDPAMVVDEVRNPAEPSGNSPDALRESSEAQDDVRRDAKGEGEGVGAVTEIERSRHPGGRDRDALTAELGRVAALDFRANHPRSQSVLDEVGQQRHPVTLGAA